MKRFVKILSLVDDPGAIKAYREVHDNIWPEITEGIRSVGITMMDIYLHGNVAVMIMEVPDDVDVDRAMSRLAGLPRQAEWEEYVARFQQCLAHDTSDEKWKQMEKIFTLPQ